MLAEFCSTITEQTNKKKDVWNFTNRLNGYSPENSSPFVLDNQKRITNPTENANTLVKQFASSCSDEGY